MQIVDEQLGRIASGNRFYNYNRSNWRFLLTSYLGGEDYKRGQYLTRYQLETDTEYSQRLENTPLENHCRAVINVYNSFLFREQPERDLGRLAEDATAAAFLEDADLEGRSLDAFMRDVSTWASVFGHCWVMMAKPNVGAVTKADEQVIGVRPYVSLLTPLVVVDWSWERLPSGYYDLKRFKYVEEINGSVQTVRQWTPEAITTWHIDFDTRTVLKQETEPNGLGFIPVTCVYTQRSMVRGIGVSDIQDIAGMQRFIYNQLSEVEQTVRLDGHPSLVKTNETQAGAGAGSIVSMPENLDPGLKPYLLEYNGASIASIYQAITQAVDSIDKMANTGSVRATAAKLLSGVAMQTEFQLLNAKLSEKANNLELAEEQMWKMFALYQGTEWTGRIHYQDSYSIQDEEQEFVKLQVAKSAATSPETLALIDQKLMELINDSLSIEEAGPSIIEGDEAAPAQVTEPSPATAVRVGGQAATNPAFVEQPVPQAQPRTSRRQALQISARTY
jgi:hypothetical protein